MEIRTDEDTTRSFQSIMDQLVESLLEMLQDKADVHKLDVMILVLLTLCDIIVACCQNKDPALPENVSPAY